MPDLYRSLDVFVLASVFEMMPIAILEALASGLPVIANRIPQLQWMVGGGCSVFGVPSSRGDSVARAFCPGTLKGGEVAARPVPGQNARATEMTEEGGLVQREEGVAGGCCMDMARDGALVECLSALTPGWIEEHGRAARAHAVKTFSTDAVIGQYIDYYRQVLA